MESTNKVQLCHRRGCIGPDFLGGNNASVLLTLAFLAYFLNCFEDSSEKSVLPGSMKH